MFGRVPLGHVLQTGEVHLQNLFCKRSSKRKLTSKFVRISIIFCSVIIFIFYSHTFLSSTRGYFGTQDPWQSNKHGINIRTNDQQSTYSKHTLRHEIGRQPQPAKERILPPICHLQYGQGLNQTIQSTTRYQSETTSSKYRRTFRQFQSYEQKVFVSNRKETVSINKPLCLDKRSYTLLNFEIDESCCSNQPGQSKCGLSSSCKRTWWKARNDSLFRFSRSVVNSKWLEENKKDIDWVRGTSLLQTLERTCPNIFHFSRKVLFIFHVLANFQGYAERLDEPIHIFLFPDKSTLQKLMHPSQSGDWQFTFLRSLFDPFKYSINSLRTLDIVGLKRTSVSIMVVNDFDDQRKRKENNGTKYICFEKAIISGFLNQRLFITDGDIPFRNNDMNRGSINRLSVPVDSLKFRLKLSNSLRSRDEIPRMKRKLTFIFRKSARKRRVFDRKLGSRLVEMLRSIANELSFGFNVVSFSNMTFYQQYLAMAENGILVGAHGADLVNSIFMPPGSALIELFPYGFEPVMYREGAGSGLYYFNYTLSKVEDFPSLHSYSSVAECVHDNYTCLMFYRDTVLKPSDLDISNIKALVIASAKLISSNKIRNFLY